MIKFDVKNCFSGEVQFTAKIDCADDTPISIKLGLAVKWAIKTGADLAGADLAGAGLAGADLAGANLARANLADAYLAGADLAGADLARANLADAYLAGANLRSFKADMWMTLTQAGAPHVIDLIAKLRAGEVDGSTYGEENGCACLVGTLEKHGATGVDRGASNPAERWFAPIKPGDVPNGEGEGPFRARLAIEWAEEWCAANGVTVSPHPDEAKG